MFFRLIVTAVFAGFFMASSAQAAVVQLTEAQFNTQTAGLDILQEDFEGFALGTTLQPSFVLANATASFEGFIQSYSHCWVPYSAATQCLANTSGVVNTPKVFENFVSGTTYFSIQHYAFSTADTYEVTVTGGAGSSTFTATGTSTYFWGFYDPDGITSVSFVNLGYNLNGSGLGGWGNFSFDNLTTAGNYSAVPVPAALWLFTTGLLGMVGVARRRERA